MQRSIWAVLAATLLIVGAAQYGQSHAQAPAGPAASVSAGLGLGANVLVGGSSKQITLQPLSVEGSVGLNIAAGVAEIQLTPGN